MATAFTGVHFAHPELAILEASAAVYPSLPLAPLRPTAPIKDPPNQAAKPRSWTLRRTVLRSDIVAPHCEKAGRRLRATSTLAAVEPVHHRDDASGLRARGAREGQEEGPGQMVRRSRVP
ncbi:hypothetical protein GCM10010518_53080 [Kitasatospora cinereorecta]